MSIRHGLYVLIFLGIWIMALNLQETRILSKPCVDVRLHGPDDYASWKGE